MGGLPTATVNGFASDPSNPARLYAALRPGVFRSEDGGQGWTLTAGPADAAAVAVDPARPAEVLAVTTDGRLFVSRDGGLTWERGR